MRTLERKRTSLDLPMPEAQARAAFQRLAERSTQTWADFPLAIFRIAHDGGVQRVTAHWAEGKLLLVAEKDVEELLELLGMTPLL